MNGSAFQLGSKKLVAALLAAGVLGGVGATAVQHLQKNAQAQVPAVVAQAAPSAVAPAAVALPNFSSITAQAGPAVVNISVRGTRTVGNDDGDDDADAAPSANRGSQMDPDDPMLQFFKQFGLPMPQQGQRGFGRQMPQEVPMAGEGSGFIVSADGTILTNAHVVKGAKTVTVKLTDRREFKAKVLGSDAKTDIAVLKIDAKDLPVAKLGDSKAVQQGEWVLAIGSPFGFDNSVTAGVVSAKGRALPDDSAVPFIQTDVAVNPGNSGGPLLNTRGEVVGINSQIYSRSGGYQGLSFAIPIDLAVNIKDQIVAHGKVEHARLGVVIQEVNQAFADSFKLPKPEGALVASVEKGGPADKAGLQPGDVITSYNGQAIVSSNDLPAAIATARPGANADLQVWRQGKPTSVQATLGGNTSKDVKQAANEQVGKGKLGLALRELTPQEKQGSGAQNGLVVERAAGPAAMAGVQPGDVVLSVNGVPVSGIDALRQQVAQSDKSVALLIERNGQKIFVPVQLG
ncbi:DegQ family serine endoprotease [Comamonas sp. J-3]|uniref:DegQ family serine endoprotease n=1 Tax=Comamonas trifloxystrobinivorans TaxID=3350256 RepID=UPI0037276B4F